MNKKILFLVFLLVLIWNMSFILFCDFIREDDGLKKLEPSDKNAESGKVGEMISVYNHETLKTEYMPLEEYIVCVLAAEMPTGYGLEALKAQAVAARTYTLYCIKNGKHSDVDVCTDYRHCQAFKENEEIVEVFSPTQQSLVRHAVNETAGQIIVYDGEPINAVYHASSDEMTESAENVWGNAVPYLVSVASENESGMPGFESELTLSAEGFCEKLHYAGYDIDFASKSIFTCTNSSGRVDYVKFAQKSGGYVTITGTQMRNIFSLRSCSFDITFEGDKVKFNVRGYGHGVGMSQYGAKVMAQAKCTYEQIILHYYSGCEIHNLSEYGFF